MEENSVLQRKDVNSQSSQFMGMEFIWWMGVVENRNDTLHLGRCQVRCFGWHSSDKTLLPTEHLPWAVSAEHVKPKEGSRVFGFFMDGKSAQLPFILGETPFIPEDAGNPTVGFTDARTDAQRVDAPRPPDTRIYQQGGVQLRETDTAPRYPYVKDEPTTSRIARNENVDNTIIGFRQKTVTEGVPLSTTENGQHKTWNEPPTSYKAKYPFDRVIESESGHVIEIDDTPGAERLHTAHRSGTYEEIGPDGTKSTKVVKDNYKITMGDDYVYIQGKCNITVKGDSNIYILGNGEMIVDGNYNLGVKGDYNLLVKGNMNQVIGGNVDEKTTGDETKTVGGVKKENVVGNIMLNGNNIYLNES